MTRTPTVVAALAGLAVLVVFAIVTFLNSDSPVALPTTTTAGAIEATAAELEELEWCGLWERVQASDSNSPRDGIRVEVPPTEDIGTVVEVTAGAGSSVGDILWRSIGSMDDVNYQLEVQGPNGRYFPTKATDAADGMRVLVAEGAQDRSAAWRLVDTSGCDPAVEEASAASGADGTDGTDDRPQNDSSKTAVAPRSCKLFDLWLLDSPAFAEVITSRMPADEPAGSVVHAGGVYDMDLRDEGSFTSTRTDWELLFSSPEGSVYLKWNGFQEGTVIFDAGTLEWLETGSDMQWSVEAVVDGQRQTIPPFAGPTVNTDFLSGEGTYECVGDVLTVTIAGTTTKWLRSG